MARTVLEKMGKSCCAIGCCNRYSKGYFYRFPKGKSKSSKWIAAVRREKWEPTEHTWLCSAHFISGKKSDDPLSPDYTPSIFSFTDSPLKRKSKQKLGVYERRKNTKKTRRLQHSQAVASESILVEAEVEAEFEIEDDSVRQCDDESIESSDENRSSMHEELSTIRSEQGTQTLKMVDSSTMTDMSMIYLEALEQ